MKKLILFVPILLGLVLFAGCGNQDKKVEKVVEDVFTYNHEGYKKEQIFNYFDSEKSNVDVWEDAGNYYVLLSANKTEKTDGKKFEFSMQDGYKVGKENNKISKGNKVTKKCTDFKNENKKTIYSKTNVTLKE